MNSLRRNIWLMLFMVAAFGVSRALYPTHKIANDGPAINLETMIPKQFAGWKIDKNIVPVNASPEAQAEIKLIYTQTLSRTYVNSNGQRVMLSIAYGGDQREGMQVHKPEVCYPAQGFRLLKSADGELKTKYGNIPVRRLVAVQGLRYEPITYWITVGDTAAIKSLDWKLAQLKYGLTGKIPDGLLFRVSSINPDDSSAYALQESFIKDLLPMLSPFARAKLTGLHTVK